MSCIADRTAATPSATAFLAEHSEAHKGCFASWQWASAGVTSLIASGFGVSLTGH